MDNGFITIHRKIFEWEWHDDSKTGWLWIYLLTHANWKDNRWHGLLITRGQLVTGRLKLSKETGLSVRNVRTSLKRLKQTGEINVKSTNKFSIITIIKYDTYQTEKNESDQQVTSKRPASDHNLIKKQGNKEDNNTISFECDYFRVTKDEVDDYCGAYNTTEEILQSEFIKMKVWLKNNPSKRKKDYPRFIGNWLNRHFSDNGKGGDNGATNKRKELDAYMDKVYSRAKST